MIRIEEQPINKTLAEIQHFFNTQAFADGLRATVAILLPALIGRFTGHFQEGIALSLGSMSVSLTDAPGPYHAKRNGMLAASAFIFLVALLTSFARLNVLWMAAEIAAITFFFSMFNVYGNRAAAVGNAAILIMIVTMDKPSMENQHLSQALLILCGGLFYTGLSLAMFRLWPYRIVQRVLGDCVREIARYLSVKADFYLPGTGLKEDYNNVVNEQIKVHEKQDAVREVMFKTRTIAEESTALGRKLLLTFVETVDLFEYITATYYDYALLRKTYQGKGILEAIGQSLKKMAEELDQMGKTIEANSRFTRSFDYDAEIISLKQKIDALAAAGEPTQVLKKILVNIRKILNSFNSIALYFETADVNRSGVDHSRFISHQSLHPRLFWQNFTLQSVVFRHALRVSLASLTGFLVARLIGYGEYSYWILLTIAFILKPAFSLTRKRNIERIIGTVAGGAVAVLIFFLIPSPSVQFALMVIFMLGTYSFLRTHYLAMVFFVTPYVLLLFKFFGIPLVELAGERILDTVIGSAIAFGASYLLWPTWEADQLRVYMEKMLKANRDYLAKIIEALQGRPPAVTEYKIVRKNVYVASANLSSAFQRMLSEPKSKQVNTKDAQQFVVLNHVLFSNIASVGTQIFHHPQKYASELIRTARRALEKLERTVQLFSTKKMMTTKPPEAESSGGVEDAALKEQLEYIDKLSGDVEKISQKMVASAR